MVTNERAGSEFPWKRHQAREGRDLTSTIPAVCALHTLFKPWHLALHDLAIAYSTFAACSNRQSLTNPKPLQLVPALFPTV